MATTATKQVNVKPIAVSEVIVTYLSGAEGFRSIVVLSKDDILAVLQLRGVLHESHGCTSSDLELLCFAAHRKGK